MKLQKKWWLALMSVCLVLTLSIGGTLAYLSRETEKRVNNFTFADGDSAMSAVLTESKWDGVIDYEYAEDGSIANLIYDYIDNDNNPDTPDVPVYGYEGGDKSKFVTSPTAAGAGVKPTFDSTDGSFKPVYGTDSSKNMIPGQSAAKNPAITNTNSTTDQWVAIRITFVYGADSDKAGTPLSPTDLTTVLEVLAIDFNTTDWERVSSTEASVSQTFYYKSLLTKGADGENGATTADLFTAVTLDSSATAAQIAALNAFGGIAIFAEGFAVQADAGANYDAFKAWGATGVTFSNTPTNADPAVLAEPGIIPAA